LKNLSLYHVDWLVPFKRYLERQGVGVDAYLAEVGIDRAVVSSEAGWIPKPPVYRFLTLVAEQEQIPDLGFQVGESFTPASLGTLGDAVNHAESLAEAIEVFCRLINRHAEENRSWLEEDEAESSQVWLLNQTTNPFDAKREIADQAGAMTLVNIVRLAAGSDWYPRRLKFQTSESKAYRNVPGLQDSDVRFNSTSTGIAFPSRWLFRVINARGKRTGERAANNDLLDNHEPVVEKLSRILGSLVGAGGLVPTLDLMADLCQTSPRTLQRRIREGGASYKELLRKTRLEHAKAQLLHLDGSIKEIAMNLGYSAPSNFVRAFKQGTGISPTEYRNSMGVANAPERG
jgi:AraC-like DNA-binding protein